MIATNPATAATMPMTALSRNQTARASTSAATIRIPNEVPVFSSMPTRIRPSGARHSRFSHRRGRRGERGAGPPLRPRPGARPDLAPRRAAPGGELRAREAIAPHARRARVPRRDGVAALDEYQAGGGGAVGERHGAMFSPRRPLSHLPAVRTGASGHGPAVERPRGARGGLERGALRAVQAPAHPPARAREREVRDGGEAALVGAQGEQ